MGEAVLLKPGLGNVEVKGLARDGSLFYATNLDQTDIYVAGLDPATGKLTSEPKRVNQRAVGNSWGRVAWLPDGKSVSCWQRPPVEALVVHTFATGEEREVWGGTSGRATGRYTGWLPDGSVMRWEDGSQKWVFRRVDSRTGAAQASWTVPAPPAGASSPVFSPDLMTMFFARRDDTVRCQGNKCTYDMLARDLENGQDRELFRIVSYTPRPSISPDGREMALIDNDELAQRILIASTAGGPPREFYRSPSDVSFTALAWTRDGGRVLAFRSVPAGGEVWSFPVKSGPPDKSPLNVQPSEAPAVSPDGTQVAFVGGGRRSEIWVMTGLLPDTRPARAR